MTDTVSVEFNPYLSGKSVSFTSFVVKLHVEVPYRSIEVFVLFGAEEFDHSLGSLQLENQLIPVSVLVYGEYWEILFKHQRKGFAWLVDQQKVGFGNILVDEIFETSFHGEFKPAKKDAFFGHISPPPSYSILLSAYIIP